MEMFERTDFPSPFELVLVFLPNSAIYQRRVMNNEETEPKTMISWLTLEEAAQYLKMGKSTLYDLARKEKIPAHKMGREWRFDAEELDRWLKKVDEQNVVS